jgi:endonuclease-3 related protein
MLPKHKAMSDYLLQLYDLMNSKWGDRGWWPADSIEEIVIGAILVQNVSWSNVERAIKHLKACNLLTFAKLLNADPVLIGRCIRSTRFYNSKAQKLIAFAHYLETHHDGDITRLLDQTAENLRQELLKVFGIGPETADDIVLYAAEKPTFVVDAYTRRIFSRLEILPSGLPYETMRQWFLSHLPHTVSLLNQYHALLDAVGHYHCLPRNPGCNHCPLRLVCPYAQQHVPLHQQR